MVRAERTGLQREVTGQPAPGVTMAEGGSAAMLQSDCPSSSSAVSKEGCELGRSTSLCSLSALVKGDNVLFMFKN